jgi:RNA polymerase sigma factor (sigma-70 family)
MMKTAMPKDPRDEFEDLYRDTFPSVSKFIFFKIPNKHDVDDLVQSVYTDFYRVLVEKKQRPDNIMAYLMTMAKSEIAHYYRDRDAFGLQVDTKEHDPFEQIPDDHDEALAVIERSTVDVIYTQIGKLPDVDQKILVGHFKYFMTFAELAKQLDLSENTVKTRYYRAIALLRDRLAEKPGERK